MVFSDDYAATLREWWESRGRVMPESNLKQAEHPVGAELLTNPKGTAPGLAITHDDTLVFCVPGVPAEMEHLLHADVLPRLAKRSGKESVLVSRVLRTWGRSESDVAETLDDFYRETTNPSIAFLASGGEIKVRITAKADNPEEAMALIEPYEMKIRERLGSTVFGIDDETIERVLLDLLHEAGYTIGTAESMTGGMVSAALTSLPGSSSVVRGGLVAYAQDLKKSLLGVDDLSTVVDLVTAEQMAVGARRLLDVDVAVSVTGSAGPEPLEKPPGTMVIGVSTPERTQAKEMRMVGDRERIRAYAVTKALQLTRLALIGKWWQP
jgi:nicotinamide-nucleotide amidase